jgi:hypothetical protein
VALIETSCESQSLSFGCNNGCSVLFGGYIVIWLVTACLWQGESGIAKGLMPSLFS